MITNHIVIDYHAVSFKWNVWSVKDMSNLNAELIYKEPKSLSTTSLLFALLNQKVFGVD